MHINSAYASIPNLGATRFHLIYKEKHMERRDIAQKLYDLRRKGREKHLELAGVEVKKLRALEERIDADFGKLAEAVKKDLAETGAEVADRHEVSRNRTVMIDQKVAEGVISPHITDMRAPIFCICLSHNFAADAGHGHEPAILTPPSGGTGIANVTFETTGCVAHPIADARGQGTGTTNSAEITSWCRYSFMPSVDGLYCIKPLIYLNGHYLVWTWGTCSGLAEDLGTATAQVVVTVQVDQLSLPVKTVAHTVVDKTGSGGSDTQSGFAYDSEIDGGASTSVFLQGGHEAVVWIKCTAFAEVVNHGRAWVDMQTSPKFYAKVDQVRWGRILCFPWAHSSPLTATPISLPAPV